MAGPPRTSRARSPFAQEDDGHQVYSPLAKLVRKASLNHSSGGVPTYASLGLNRSTGAAPSSSETRPGNMRSASDQNTAQRPALGQPKKSAPPNLVLHEPEEAQGHQSHRRAQPSSPLLHTRFRASVATSIGSSSDLDGRDSQEVDYPFHPNHPHHAQQHSAFGSDSAYTPSPTAHRPFAYVIDDTHAGAAPSPTSQYSGRQESLPPSPNQPFQFDMRTSVAPSEDIRPPFQYDPRASSLTVSTDAPFHYDDSAFTATPSKLSTSALPTPSRFSANNIHSTRSSNYNPRGTWRSSAAPEPDPFSFRDYEAPRVEPPIVVVHSPMSVIQDQADEELDADRFYLGDSAGRGQGAGTGQGGGAGGNGGGLGGDEEDVGSTSYHDAYEYVYGAIEADDQNPDEDERTETGDHYFKPSPAPTSAPQPTSSSYYEPSRDSTTSDNNFFQPDPDPTADYFEPEPVVAIPAAVSSGSVGSSGGRVASVVAGGRGYNYSRPLRAGGGASISGNLPGQSNANQPETGNSTSASAGRSPLRKATGPLIFSTQPEEEGYQSTGGSDSGYSGQQQQRGSPQPQGYGRQSPNPQYANSRDPNSQYTNSPGQQYAQTSKSQYTNSPSPQYANSSNSQTPNSQYAPSPNSQLTQSPNSSNSQLGVSPTGRPPSLYSQYSFYSLPGSTPPESPSGTPDQRSQGPGQLRQKPSGSLLNPNAQQGRGSPSSSSPTDTPTTKSLNPNAAKANSAAQQYLTRGIQAHEQNNLRESARCFERSANEGGGCGVGMLMWGLSLRHGWGCRKDERTGFRWLRRAAEAAVADLESARSGEEAKAVRNELVLAIYEVGQCFFHGWGVGQDKTMAVVSAHFLSSMHGVLIFVAELLPGCSAVGRLRCPARVGVLLFEWEGV